MRSGLPKPSPCSRMPLTPDDVKTFPRSFRWHTRAIRSHVLMRVIHQCESATQARAYW